MFRLCNKIVTKLPRSLSTENTSIKNNKDAIKTSLVDNFGRHHTYLRISLTERCNLRCQYCMPAEGVKLTEKSRLLTTSEIVHLSRLFVNEGVEKIRLTGGEPTIRKDLPEIIQLLKQIDGLKSIGLTTNGLVLTKQLVSLQRAGLDHLNISLDTLKREKYERITRRKGWERVMLGIDLALQLGYSPVKINCVLIKGFNEDEVCDFVRFTQKRDVDVRFIEYMPFSGNRWELERLVSYKEMLERIREEFGGIYALSNGPNDTSKAWKVPGFAGQIGFITSMTQHFCNSCNRLRITADGNLKVCLFGNTEVSLRDAMRSGCKEDDLRTMISVAVKRKHKQHADFLSPSPQLVAMRAFSTLSHLTPEGSAHMVDVTNKDDTVRLATARGVVNVGYAIVELIKNNVSKKGDVLSIAQLAGILGAKKTSELIPLCHNIPLTKIDVSVKLNEVVKAVEIEATCQCVGKTGVEMEALTAVSLAALTVYDMCKSAGHDIVIGDIELVKKTGGKSDYVHEPIVLPELKGPIEYTPVGGI